jgi:hypothetical protein
VLRDFTAIPAGYHSSSSPCVPSVYIQIDTYGRKGLHGEDLQAYYTNSVLVESLQTTASKRNNHQQTHSVYYYIHYKNLLHVSTPPGHLQEEQCLYTMDARIQLSENVPLTSQLRSQRHVLPEDDPAGFKHVGGSYSEYNNTHCAFVGNYFFYVIKCTDMEHIKLRANKNVIPLRIIEISEINQNSRC